jgi:hypothetical protein
MKFLNFIKSFLFTAPKVDNKIEGIAQSIVEIPDVVAEAIAEEAVKPKKKKSTRKK